MNGHQRWRNIMTDESHLGKKPGAPPDDADQDALKDADIQSGTVGTKEAYPPREGEVKKASDTTPQEAGSF
jgi:hypothetical protein